jgi:tetratricopeptide (TPR) repeat protein
MKQIKILFIILIPLCLLGQADEKRLALVIGNANYDKGALINPVNDSRLIAAKLDSLNFDVILEENLSTKREMTDAIRKFGFKRSEYDIALVYYAGHAIQINGENFLVPTKEIFKNEKDVKDYGVNIEKIIRYFEFKPNELNILILDACRDNPYQIGYNTRSIMRGGLAEMSPTKGSLIAFSTESGKVASDGDGDNSIYTSSLVENMGLKNISIDQVFRNVRADVMAKTEDAQVPIEITQLVGQTFYLVKTDLTNIFKEINNIINTNGDLFAALKNIELILSKDSENTIALKLELIIYKMLGENTRALSICNKLIKLESNNPEYYLERTSIYENLGEFGSAIDDYIKAITLSPKKSKYYFFLGDFFNYTYNDTVNAIKYYKKGLELNSKSKEGYIAALSNLTNDYNYSLQMYGETINKNPNDFIAYRNRAILYAEYFFDYNKAIRDFNKSIALSPDEPLNYFFRGNFYRNKLQDYSKAIEDYNKGLKINPENYAIHYEKALTYKIIDDIENNEFTTIEAILNLSISIENFKNVKIKNDFKIYPKSSGANFEKQLSNLYKQRGIVFKKIALKKLMCEDFKKSVNLDKADNEIKLLIGENCGK